VNHLPYFDQSFHLTLVSITPQNFLQRTLIETNSTRCILPSSAVTTLGRAKCRLNDCGSLPSVGRDLVRIHHVQVTRYTPGFHS
jgi:hypothetical protein